MSIGIPDFLALVSDMYVSILTIDLMTQVYQDHSYVFPCREDNLRNKTEPK